MDKHIEALRNAALKATRDKWVAFSNVATGTFAVHTPQDERCGDIIDWMGFDGAAGSNIQKSRNAKFIAAANPVAVLGLIAQLEAAERKCHSLSIQLELAIEKAGRNFEFASGAENENIALRSSIKFANEMLVETDKKLADCRAKLAEAESRIIAAGYPVEGGE